MIDLTDVGACPRRPLTYALSRAMKYPNAPVDVPLGDCDLGVVATGGSMSEAIEMLGNAALRSGRSWLMANFQDDVTTECRGLVLLRPVEQGILIGMVEPCLLRPGAPILLVSTDRTRCFEMTAAGRLVDRQVPRPARVKEGIERAWAELVRRMRLLTAANGQFRYESWEIHLTPANSTSH
ncbi:MAG: hypothetical protein GW858_10770 [Sphingomonadales bacterium]|nr:hypothetical protein [Sphingomonadales bacterium]NCQ22191.1 hypothetical protein [Sphingomonadales bacterium]NCT03549.1 hypothetical protein [Sphingomonadales bacterium]